MTSYRRGDLAAFEDAVAERIVQPPRSDARVEAVAELLAGLEEGDVLLADTHAVAGAWVAPLARLAPLHREGAEAPELDPVTARQRRGDLVEDRADDAFDVALIEVPITFSQALD